LGIFWSKLPGSVRNADNVDITLAMGVLCGVMVPLAGDLLGLFTWIMLPDMLRPENPEPWLRIIRGTVIVASIIAGVTRGFNES
jgi:hypothetical protein